MSVLRIFLFSLMFLSSFLFYGQESSLFSLEDIISGKYYARGVWGIKSMPSGDFFTKFDVNSVTRAVFIKKYSYSTGEEVDKIVNLSKLDLDISLLYDYEFSSDQSKLLLTTNVEYIYRNSFTADFFVYDISGKKLSGVSENGSQQIATFSPTGNDLAFLRDNNLFIKSLESNKERQITFDGEKNKIINGAPDWVYEEEFAYNRAYEWSPDGKYLAYVKFNESNVKEFQLVEYAGESPHYAANELYPGLYKYKYPKAGADNSIVSLHIYNTQTNKTLDVNIGSETDIYIPRIKWTVKGDFLAYELLNREQNELKFNFVNPATGSTKTIIDETNEFYINDDFYDNIQFLPDDEHIVLMSERDGYNHLYLYNIDGQLVKQLTKGQFDVTDYYGYDGASRLFYYQAAAKSPLQREIYSVNMKGKVKEIIGQKGTNNASFSSNYKYMIVTFSNINTPTHVSLRTAKGKVIKILKDNEDISASISEFGGISKSFFTIPVGGDVVLNAYKIVPPDFDVSMQYPVIVTQYSGPNSQRVLDIWKFDWENYLAQLGFIVVGVDTRGTGGRGEKFRKVTYRELGKYETLDLVETAKYLGSLPYVNSAKIGIWGWSYGGFMVLNAMTKGNGVYSAGVAVAPVTNWRYYDNIYTERYMRKPQDNPGGYDNNSPLNYTDNFKGNLFLAFGTMDDNVHPQNSFEFIEKMVQSDNDFETFPFVNRNHGIYGGNTRLFLYRKKTNFFVEHLLD